MSLNHAASYDVIFHQVKVKVKQLIAPALRPSTSQLQAGIVRTNRQLDETFEVTQEKRMPDGRVKQEILLRIQIKLTKFPDQLSSKTVNEIIECFRIALHPSTNPQTLLPTVQGQKMVVSWCHQTNSQAPLLLLEHFKESYRLPLTHNLVNVSAGVRKKSLTGV